MENNTEIKENGLQEEIGCEKCYKEIRKIRRIRVWWKRPLILSIFCVVFVALIVVIFFIFFNKSSGSSESTTVDLKALPSSFIMGCATSAYQVEGGYDADGKGQNIWDNFTQKTGVIRNGGTGDVACDSYNKYLEDVAMISETGFQMYRFSLSWSRILPTGFANTTNSAGIEYYHNLIDALLENDIQCMVTIFHWDLPQPLQDLGGWTNPIMADYFMDFANFVFNEYGDKVKYWVTINEPWQISYGYGRGNYAPGYDDHGVSDYEAMHNVMRAHAKAYRLYESTYKTEQQGKVGISIQCIYLWPKNATSVEDQRAANRRLQFQVGMFAHPVFSTDGDYPSIVRTRVDQNSYLENRTTSRLPYFTQQEITDLKGSADFFGVNHYGSLLATSGLSGEDPSLDRDTGTVTSGNTSLPLASNSTWIRIDPDGFRSMLNWIRTEYNSPTMFITENGCTSLYGLEDYDRVYYIHAFLSAMLKAIYEDGCDIIGHISWSLMDNFEWDYGYTQKYGLWQVDFSDTNRTRTMKMSAEYFQNVTSTRTIPDINITLT